MNDAALYAALEDMERRLLRVFITRTENLMTAIADLTAAVAAIQANTASVAAAVNANTSPPPTSAA